VRPCPRSGERALSSSAAQVRPLAVALAAFLPSATALVFWPLIPAGKSFYLLELYRAGQRPSSLGPARRTIRRTGHRESASQLHVVPP
jgi:hypothetical protein